jgi:hypothetical protein
MDSEITGGKTRVEQDDRHEVSQPRVDPACGPRQSGCGKRTRRDNTRGGNCTSKPLAWYRAPARLLKRSGKSCHQSHRVETTGRIAEDQVKNRSTTDLLPNLHPEPPLAPWHPKPASRRDSTSSRIRRRP